MAEKIGFTLLHKDARPVKLTEEAKQLLKATEEIDNLLEKTKLLVEQLQRGQRGTVRVAASATFGTYLLPHILGKFAEQHEQIKVIPDIINRATALQNLADRKVDLAIIRLDDSNVSLPTQKFQAIKFMPTTYVVIAHNEHPLATYSPLPIPLHVLREHEFLRREEESGNRSDIELFCRQHDLALNYALDLLGPAMVIEAVQAKLGLAIISSDAVQSQIQHGALIALPVEGFPLENIHSWWLVRQSGNDTYHTPQAETFWNYLLSDWKKL